MSSVGEFLPFSEKILNCTLNPRARIWCSENQLCYSGKLKLSQCLMFILLMQRTWKILSKTMKIFQDHSITVTCTYFTAMICISDSNTISQKKVDQIPKDLLIYSRFSMQYSFLQTFIWDKWKMFLAEVNLRRYCILIPQQIWQKSKH